MVAQLDGALIPGQALALAPSPGRSPLDAMVAAKDSPTWQVSCNELAAQCLLTRPSFVLMTSAILAEVEHRWPVDTLEDLLSSPRGASQTMLEQFVQMYSPAEAAAMCYLLASRGECTAAVQHACRDILQNAELMGHPSVDAPVATPAVTGTPTMPAGGAIAGTGVGVQEQSAMRPAGEAFGAAAGVKLSAAHEGLCLYVCRVLELLWEQVGALLLWLLYP